MYISRCSASCYFKTLTVFLELRSQKTVGFEELIFFVKLRLLLFIIRQIFCNTREKNVYEQRSVFSVEWFLLAVFWYDLMNKKIFPFFCNNHKTLTHLELNLKRRLIIVDVKFENWGISIRWYSRISFSFSWGIFVHVLR